MEDWEGGAIRLPRQLEQLWEVFGHSGCCFLGWTSES